MKYPIELEYNITNKSVTNACITGTCDAFIVLFNKNKQP